MPLVNIQNSSFYERDPFQANYIYFFFFPMARQPSVVRGHFSIEISGALIYIHYNCIIALNPPNENLNYT
jgi:hypothetical protein